jgi:hypothetical protein
MEVSPSRELLLLDSEPGFFAFYALQNIMIACWSKGGTGPAVQRVAEQRARMDKQHPEGVSVVYLIANDAGLPTAEARAGVRQLIERYRHQRACLAVVVQGEGFWASGMRAVITGVRMLVPGQLAMRVYGRVEEVVAWLPAQHQSATGVVVAPEELLPVLTRLMATL